MFTNPILIFLIITIMYIFLLTVGAFIRLYLIARLNAKTIALISMIP